jgi:hypothetical protein
MEIKKKKKRQLTRIRGEFFFDGFLTTHTLQYFSISPAFGNDLQHSVANLHQINVKAIQRYMYCKNQYSGAGAASNFLLELDPEPHQNL